MRMDELGISITGLDTEQGMIGREGQIILKLSINNHFYTNVSFTAAETNVPALYYFVWTINVDITIICMMLHLYSLSVSSAVKN